MVRRVVILGAGYGGLNAALHLEKRLSQSEDRDWEIVLVDQCSYHQHIIMVHEIAANSTPPEEAVVPMAYLLNGKRVTFMQGEVRSVDLGQQQVAFDGRRVDYDRLVIALGSETNYFGIPGARENTLELKSVDDARRINAQIKRMFVLASNVSREGRADLLTFVVCGGGYSGVELTGELADWLPDLALSSGIDPSEVRLVVVEAAPSILMGYPAGLPGKASELLKGKGVELRVGSAVAEITQGVVKVRSGDPIAARTIVWTGGVQGPAALAQWGLQTGPKGRAMVNGYLESTSHPGVYVIGDCSLVVNPNTGRPLAPSAQVALQQAPQVAENLEAELIGGERKLFRPAGTGEVFSLGRRSGYALVGRISFDGYPARLLKEVVALRYYLNLGGPALVMEKMPGGFADNGRWGQAATSKKRAVIRGVTKVELEQLVLMEKCPLCGKGQVVQVRGKGARRLDVTLAHCPSCGSTFQTTGSGGIELSRCEPDLLARALGMESPTACKRCRHCLQGVSLYKGEWKRLGERGWMGTQPSATYEDFALHTQSQTAPIGIELECGEEIRLEVYPVYVGEELLGLESTAARAVVTTRRLLLLDGDALRSFPLESISAVEEGSPGLWIQFESSDASIYLFAPPSSDGLARLKLKLNSAEKL